MLFILMTNMMVEDVDTVLNDNGDRILKCDVCAQNVQKHVFIP